MKRTHAPCVSDTEYVIFDDSRCVPEYTVEYTHNFDASFPPQEICRCLKCYKARIFHKLPHPPPLPPEAAGSAVG